MDRKRNVKLMHKRKTGRHSSWENHDKNSNKSPMILAENCVEFCRGTTLHGFKYIFEKNTNDGCICLRKVRRIIAYIIWITGVICGAAFGLYLMSLVWIRYQNTPTITTIDTNNYPIWNIPFPGVTVCNLNSVYKPSTKELTKEFGEKFINLDYLHKDEWRTAGSGQDVGLRMHLNIQEENYVVDKKPYSGINIIIHSPYDYPESIAYAVGQPGEEVGIAVIPSVVSTDDSVRNIDIKRRLCKFNDEKRLRIPGPYSFALCLTECRALTIIKICKCLPFFFPEFDNDNTSSHHAFRQCTLRDVQCLADNNHIFSSLEPPPDLKQFFNKTNIGMECDCYQSCSEITYDISVTNAKRFTKEVSEKRATDNVNWTIVRVYFKDLSCIKYRREIYMTWDGVLSSFGGIFGLCMGGSVISLIEFFYLMVIKYLYKSIGYEAEAIVTVVTTQKKVLPRADNRRVKPVFKQSKDQGNAPMEYQFLM